MYVSHQNYFQGIIIYIIVLYLKPGQYKNFDPKLFYKKLYTVVYPSFFFSNLVDY